MTDQKYIDLATTENTLTSTYLNFEDYENAEYFNDKAIDKYKKYLPSNHPYLIRKMKLKDEINMGKIIKNRNEILKELF